MARDSSSYALLGQNTTPEASEVSLTIVVFPVDRELWDGETDSWSLENEAFLIPAEVGGPLLGLATTPVYMSGPGRRPTWGLHPPIAGPPV